MKNFSSFIIAGLQILLIGGCAIPPAMSPEQIVAQRMKERWDFLIAGNLEKAYTYISPAGRSVTSLDNYKLQIRPGNWKNVELKSVSCEPELCKVNFILYYKIMSKIDTKNEFTENWVKDGNNWWFVYTR